MFDRLSLRSIAIAALLATAPAALAQEDGAPLADMAADAPPPDGAVSFAPWAPTWSSPEVQRLSERLIGTWKTTAAVPQVGAADGAASEIIFIIQPCPVEGMTDALYAEAYRTETPGAPYRQNIMQVYMYKGQPRLRTFTFAFPEFKAATARRRPEDRLGVFAGMGLIPEAFPTVGTGDLIATMDLEIVPSATGFTGRSPQPFPTNIHGAVLMTSELTVDGDTLSIADRGFAADGSIAWGAGSSGTATFARAEPHIKIQRRDQGLLLLDFVTPDGTPVVDGGRLNVHYAGWTRDGYLFDTSRQPGRREFPVPFPPQLIEGWNVGLDGLTTGSIRKLVFPGALGYGERGQPQASIPPNAPLYFTVEVRLVETPEQVAPPPAPVEAPAEDAAPAEGDAAADPQP